MHEPENTPGYVKRKIRERKTSKEKPLVTRARASQAHVSIEKEQKVDDLLAPHLPTAAKAWVDGLKATKTAWNQQSHQFEDTGLPDHKIRAECAEKIWHNTVGRPIERTLQVSGGYKELSEVLSELGQLPEARRLLSPELFESISGGGSSPSNSPQSESAPAHEPTTIQDSSQNTG